MQIHPFLNQTFQAVKQTMNRVLNPQQQIICAIALAAFSCLTAAYLALRFGCHKISLTDKTTTDPQLNKTQSDPEIAETTIDAEIDETTIDAEIPHTTIDPEIDEATFDAEIDETTIDAEIDEAKSDAEILQTTIDPKIDEATIDAEFEKGLNEWTENQINSDNSLNTEKAANKIREAYYGKQSNLDLSKLKLTSIPAEIGQLSQLVELLLTHNQIQQLPESFGQLTQLQSLGLHDNQIQQLPESILQLTQLQSLDLHDNQIQQLPESILQLTQLQSLDLGVNQIQELPESFEQLSQLQSLHLGANLIQQLPESFGQLSQLQSLNLADNQIKQLPESFGQLSQLKDLDLAYNQIQQLPESFGQLSQLQSLNLAQNQIQQLPESFGQLTQLQSLDLGVNQIQQLPESFEQLSHLIWLKLENNKIQQLPESFGQLTQLKNLYLSHNHIQQLPESFGHLQQLSSLHLDHNPIHFLPMSLGQCTNLTSISSRNTSIPAEMKNLILAICAALRAKEAAKILPARLKTWQTFAKQQFELSFIEDMPEKEKQTINEWLVRLERTHDFNKPLMQEKLAKSACQMLASLANSPSFKEIFFIQVPLNLVACGDRAAMSFNELGIAWTCDTLNLSAISAKEKLNTLIQAAKTLTLYKSLQKRIEAEEKKQGVVIKEGVEIFLYYETHLQKTLNLLTFMSGMLYSTVGKRAWIHEANLVEEVNTNYRDCLLDQPALLVLCQADPKFKADWQKIEDGLYKKIENLDPTLLGEGNYKLQADLLKQEFETQKRALMLKWVKKLT